MGDNVYIAYALWLLTGWLGAFLALFCFKLFATYKQERARRLYDLRSTAMGR